MHLKDLQEFIDFNSAKCSEYENKNKNKKDKGRQKNKGRKENEEKNKFIRKMDATNKIVSLELNIDKQKQ